MIYKTQKDEGAKKFILCPRGHSKILDHKKKEDIRSNKETTVMQEERRKKRLPNPCRARCVGCRAGCVGREVGGGRRVAGGGGGRRAMGGGGRGEQRSKRRAVGREAGCRAGRATM